MIRLAEKFDRVVLRLNPDEVEESAWVSMQALKDTLHHQQYCKVPGFKVSSRKQEPADIDTQAFYPLYRYNPLK